MFSAWSGAGDVVLRRLVVHPQVVGRPVVQFLGAALEPLGGLARVVLPGLFPPRLALGVPEVPNQFVQRLGHAAGPPAFEPAVHLLFEQRRRGRARR